MSVTVVRRLVTEKKVAAVQIVPGAPWEIPMAALGSEEVRKEVLRIKNRISPPRIPVVEEQQHLFSI